MRKGHNPAKKDVDSYRAEKLGIVSLLYIPILDGYFSNSWEVFLYHLYSVHKYTPKPFNYFVFDNGSCHEIRTNLQGLQEQGLIDWIFLSDHNMGKTGALNMVLPGLPNEWICYTDSDMLFREGWLDASWKIENSFPNCGMIGAQIIFPDWEVDKGNSIFRKTLDPKFKFDQIEPEKWIVEEYCRGRGIIGNKKNYYESALIDRVTNVENGCQAILGGNSHQQFLVQKEIIKKILPLPSKFQLNRNEDTYQDVELDKLGYLHLTTTKPFLYHMGNTIDEELKPELEFLNIAATSNHEKNIKVRKNNIIWKILFFISKNKLGRNILNRLYDNLYDILT